jgi:hypothetical protein
LFQIICLCFLWFLRTYVGIHLVSSLDVLVSTIWISRYFDNCEMSDFRGGGYTFIRKNPMENGRRVVRPADEEMTARGEQDDPLRLGMSFQLPGRHSDCIPVIRRAVRCRRCSARAWLDQGQKVELLRARLTRNKIELWCFRSCSDLKQWLWFGRQVWGANTDWACRTFSFFGQIAASCSEGLVSQPLEVSDWPLTHRGTIRKMHPVTFEVSNENRRPWNGRKHFLTILTTSLESDRAIVWRPSWSIDIHKEIEIFEKSVRKAHNQGVRHFYGLDEEKKILPIDCRKREFFPFPTWGESCSITSTSWG